MRKLFRIKKYDNSFIDKEFSSYIDSASSQLERNYIENRIIDQIKYYDETSVKCQNRYMVCMVFIILINGTIPVITLSTDVIGELWQKILITTLSSSVAVITAIVSLRNWRDLWIQYRSNCEILKSNLHKYFTGSGEYQIENPNRLCILVESCEKYMLQDRNMWEKIVATCTVPSQSHSTGS